MRVGVAAARVQSASPAAGGSVRVYLRPEDIVARPIAPGDSNVLDARIEKIEFLGSYCLVRVAADGLGQPLTVYLSLNFLSEQDLEPGKHAAGCASCPSGCACSMPEWSRLAIRQRADPRGPGRPCGARWSSSLALLVFLAAPLAAVLLQSVEDRSGDFVGAGQLRRLPADPGARAVALEQRLGRGAGDRAHGARRRSSSPTRSRAAACRSRACSAPSRSRRCSRPRCSRRSRSSTGSATRAC